MQLIQSNINVFINWECAEGSCFYENNFINITLSKFTNLELLLPRNIVMSLLPKV